jgi:hypothetical protein
MIELIYRCRQCSAVFGLQGQQHVNTPPWIPMVELVGPQKSSENRVAVGVSEKCFLAWHDCSSENPNMKGVGELIAAKDWK